MKKIKYLFKSLFMSLLALGFSSIIVVSCQDDDKLTNTLQHKTMFQGYSDSQIEDELISFLDNLEAIRKDPKDPLADEVMQLEPILWYMESCINYKYGNSVQPELVKIDTSYVNFNVSRTTYKLGDVQVSYDAVVDSISAVYYQLKEKKKYFLLTNISVSSQTSQNITLQVISYFSLNGIIPNVNDFDWYWGMNLGQCGTNNGAPLDAADIIMRGANASIYIPAPEFYYTDSQIGFSGHTYLQYNQQNQQLGFEGYYSSGTGPCITESEILFFTKGLIYIAEQNILEGKEIVNYWSIDEMALGLQSPYLICHSAKITYGIRHYRCTPIETLPNNPNNI